MSLITLNSQEMRALTESFIVYEGDDNGTLFEYVDKSLGNGLELYMYTTLTGTDTDRIVYGRLEVLDVYGDVLAKSDDFYEDDVRDGMEMVLHNYGSGNVFDKVKLVVG